MTLQEKIDQLLKKSDFDALDRVDIRVGTITRVEDVKGSDKLVKLTVDFGDWWFNLRPSNTEPLLRLNVEAKDRETMEKEREELFDLIRD